MSNPNFDEAAQRELSKFLEAEQAKARLQQSIHTFCDLAFDKCVTKIGMSPQTWRQMSDSSPNCLSFCFCNSVPCSIESEKRPLLHRLGQDGYGDLSLSFTSLGQFIHGHDGYGAIYHYS